MGEFTQVDNICFKCGYKKNLKEVKNDEVTPNTILHIKLCKECLLVYKKIKDVEKLKDWMHVTDKEVRFESHDKEDLINLIAYFFDFSGRD